MLAVRRKQNPPIPVDPLTLFESSILKTSNFRAEKRKEIQRLLLLCKRGNQGEFGECPNQRPLSLPQSNQYAAL